ncbi:MAG: hypothetical protein A3E83_08830 [Gammaproteobacteria bacterium RIFCSPHIGHO2_12_FULL_41_20]|nr:MAG: hypothetical protein A3E83_08830 [Gammaproteobacteria bacterium RIFCSPHIGHO2_12_FULL_41_20]
MSEVSSDLVQQLLKERKADRRWKNIRFIVWIIIISLFVWLTFFNHSTSTLSGRYVSLLRLDGMIAPQSEISSEVIVPLLQDAFKDKGSQGIILDINSPGGTPVQAAIIHNAIVKLKKKYHKKVVVVGEDLLTSGAYYIAVAADAIYVNPNTLTGSIGVIMKGFGFSGLIKKLGIERRVYTSGTDKDRLDPFLPQSPKDIEKIRQVMNEVHDNFNQAVLEGRKGKLHADPATLFTGDFWSGQTAVKLGLVDGLGNLIDVAEKEFRTSHFREYSASPGLLKILSGQVSNAWGAFLESISETFHPFSAEPLT